MYELDECQKQCKCYTCLSSTHCEKKCNNPFHCTTITPICSRHQEVGQYRCTVIAGPDTGTRGIVEKEGTYDGGLNAVRLPDGRITGLRNDEIILD